MNGLRTFSFGSSPIRTAFINGQPHVVAKDVADSLGYIWSGTKTIKHVPAKWRGVDSESTLLTLTEEGLNFFVCRSDKPKAQPFQEWIAGDLLPTLRRTGSYTMPGAVRPKLSGAFIARTREQVGFEGTNAVLERIWPEWFANLPGKRPSPPPEVITPSLNLTMPARNCELREIPTQA